MPLSPPAPSRDQVRDRRPPHRARWLAALAVVLAAVVLGADPAGAKDFGLRSLVVDATWAPDGSLEVHERIHYDFDGSFTAGIRSFPAMARGRVEDFTASEDGRPLPVVAPEDSISGEWEWSFTALDEDRTFDLSYRIPGVTAVGPDVAELYWKVIEPEGVALDELRVTIHLPTAEGVRAWGHGPPSGRVAAIAGDTVVLTTGRVSSGKLVEARVVVPATAMDVAPSGEPRLPTVLAEEARYARERQEELDRAELANRVSPVVAGLAVVAFLLIWWHWGKEPPTPDDVGDYWREPLEDPPAIVMGTLRFGSIPSSAFSATAVDLAERGYLTITEEHEERTGPDRTDYRFRQLRSPEDLASWERSLMLRLFAAGPETTMTALTAWGREHPAVAQEFWKDWQATLRKDLRSRHYVDPTRPLPYLLVVLVAAIAIATGIVALGLGAVVERVNALALLPIVVGIVLLPTMVILRRRTPTGARRAAEAEALKRFLKDFSSLDEAPVASLVMWERFLVYAVALGVSRELVAGLAVRVPEVANQSGSFATWYALGALHGGRGGGGGGGFRLDGLSSFAVDFGRGTAAAFTPSSSGSGGGFSGGGGGGFGGGSFGAR